MKVGWGVVKMKDGKQLRLAEIITRIRLSVSTCWARPSSHVLLATNFPSVNVIELTLRSRGPGWRGVRLKEIRREGGPKEESWKCQPPPRWRKCKRRSCQKRHNRFSPKETKPNKTMNRFNGLKKIYIYNFLKIKKRTDNFSKAKNVFNSVECDSTASWNSFQFRCLSRVNSCGTSTKLPGLNELWSSCGSIQQNWWNAKLYLIKLVEWDGTKSDEIRVKLDVNGPLLWQLQSNSPHFTFPTRTRTECNESI